ncbi:metal-dependent phosphoesterase [Flexivirga endophytica]|uniref:Metal-dependent phosphoesterase n=1 Tax=Flexivirga endophytica TaxID=1849103 RepID=A0A916X0F8_9MICO|nr:PHP domain-containing protein [Flexivirga endophytica]GGB45096.1 metal-dependent phosphoesterase [Flexivirga endophytica]GHB68953.1 metal-dependent phosphoesterase [Flexivirga endophytica]
MRIDLHTHSTQSDGTESPADVMRSAAKAGLDVIALTDHDTTRGWGQAARAIAETGVTLVPGIEISCAYDGISIHLLGYFIDPLDAPLLGELERARSSRRTRAQRMVERLAPDTGLRWAQVQEQFGADTTIGRPHIADALVAAGVVASRDEAFASYLASGSKYHVSHYAPDPAFATRLVRAAGGVPVMAHPFAAARGRTVDVDVIEGMADAGLAGLEVHHRDHTAEAIGQGLKLAERLGLLVTGSSDYHGTGKENQLGENTTSPEVLEALAAQATSGSGPLRP